MTKAELKAHWAYPNETLGDGYTLTHNREREAYTKGYNQAIQDACEWLKENVNDYLYNTGGKGEYIPRCGGKLFEDFRKAMEE